LTYFLAKSDVVVKVYGGMICGTSGVVVCFDMIHSPPPAVRIH
jgi:hypothetical protein